MEHRRSIEHYRDHELVCEIALDKDGWTYTIHVLAHEGDDDRLIADECSATRYGTDIEALYAAHARSREIVDGMLETV